MYINLYTKKERGFNAIFVFQTASENEADGDDDDHASKQTGKLCMLFILIEFTPSKLTGDEGHSLTESQL